MDRDAGAEHLPRLGLDQLLDELQVRIDAMRGTRDRVHSLLDAVLSVGSGLELPQVLRRIVEAATDLVDARYGALGVIGEDGGLAQFLTVGVTEQEAGAIGPLPSGHGLLGQLIRHPQPLRLPDLSRHPASSGFPAHHPAMGSFLGVPVRVRDEVFGNLYLTEKRGRGDFDEEDEAVVSTLAVAAGVAIENARLYERQRARRRWLEANARVTEGLLSGAEEPHALEMIVDHARRILGADLGALLLPVPGGPELRVALALGDGSRERRDVLVPREGTFVGLAAASGTAVTRADVGDEPTVDDVSPWTGLGPAVAVPLGTGEGLRGVLALARGKQGVAFGEGDTEPLLAYAGQAAIAMELADRRRSAEQIALLEDRDRIARDLHDVAIQRLFATGITLQSAQRFVDHPQARERLARAVDDLDETAKIIRSSIFGLRRREGAGGQGLRVRVAQLLEQAAGTLGFTPSLRMEGLVDTSVPADTAEHVTAVLAEALSNVARHAGARGVDVALVVGGGQVALSVTDDGVGLRAGGRRSGLRNLAERAERLGGTLELGASDAGGTRLRWTVPLRED
ncbi:sensor histidine kinase [Streptomyces sp. GSL17-111]|uniref:sensor histidine kinase n=1 Tax=Streptomyces sp. GSL17-111 TaxID=3121596 RepID=UPI0030F41599